ncbi:MAG: YHS domain-containing protein [Caldisericaceae bacterium]|nr:YHS domain-containing protein [Caldisericaceae bacterium]
MKYFIILLATLALLISCQKQQSEKTTQEQPQKVEQAKFHLIDLASNVCPGCGMVFKTDADIADTLHYKGKVYGFCGPKCVEAFKANPEKTLSAMHEPMEKMEGMHEEHEEMER